MTKTSSTLGRSTPDITCLFLQILSVILVEYVCSFDHKALSISLVCFLAIRTSAIREICHFTVPARLYQKPLPSFRAVHSRLHLGILLGLSYQTLFTCSERCFWNHAMLFLFVVETAKKWLLCEEAASLFRVEDFVVAVGCINHCICE